ncbi:MAG: cell division protein FtsL [Methylophilales bacterium]|jgi:cell division protein FtsL|nr:cell division protein FtsL [Pseudomonadota bacterium]NQW34615.1 cell division protein FtsL [Methylophilales bacterium]HCK04209.1 cell division protein FtsL [Methylophilaceae bacterium]|tara:strand:- start:1848 stop:2102 length:255 start_codon:yes stop_codon:yes gene_type:complete
MRLNLIFYIVLIFFALAVVSSEHQYRNNYSRLDIETKTTLDLKDEKTKLQVEEADKSGNSRIREIAGNKLNMYVPNPKEIKVIK